MARVLVIDDDASITRVTREHPARAGHVVLETARRLGVTRTLEKPFTRDELLAVVQAAAA